MTAIRNTEAHRRDEDRLQIAVGRAAAARFTWRTLTAWRAKRHRGRRHCGQARVDARPPGAVLHQLCPQQSGHFLSQPVERPAAGDRRLFRLNTSAAVSPDGSKVAMILSKSGSPNVWVCDASGTDLKRLTKGIEDSSPCWSPNGEWICFAAKINSRRVAGQSAGGRRGAQRMSTSGVPNPTEPDWSPDGKWIAFTSQARRIQYLCPGGGRWHGPRGAGAPGRIRRGRPIRGRWCTTTAPPGTRRWPWWMSSPAKPRIAAGRRAATPSRAGPAKSRPPHTKIFGNHKFSTKEKT